MNENFEFGADIAGFINYWGERIQSSGLPAWLQVILVVALLLAVLFLIWGRLYGAARIAEKQITSSRPHPDIVAMAMASRMFAKKIQNEKDPKRKAVLIQERKEVVDKLKPLPKNISSMDSVTSAIEGFLPFVIPAIFATIMIRGFDLVWYESIVLFIFVYLVVFFFISFGNR